MSREIYKINRPSSDWNDDLYFSNWDDARLAARAFDQSWSFTRKVYDKLSDCINIDLFYKIEELKKLSKRDEHYLLIKKLQLGLRKNYNPANYQDDLVECDKILKEQGKQ